MPKEFPQLISITLAAEMLQVHVNTLKNWEKEGILKPVRFGRRGDRKYRRNDLEALLKAGIQTELNYSKSIKYPRIMVAVIVEYEDRIILGKVRHDKQTKSKTESYQLPQGMLLHGESFEQTAKREIKIQTGLRIRNPRFSGITNNAAREDSGLVYLGMSISLDELPVKLKKSVAVEDWLWFDLNKLPNGIIEGHKRLVNYFQSNEIYHSASERAKQ